MEKILLRIFLIALSLTGIMAECYHGYKYHRGRFPEYVVNLEEYNSAFDDYNSTAPTIDQFHALCFSTNRKSGSDFDIIKKLLHVSFVKDNGSLYIGENVDWEWSGTELFNILDTALLIINSSGNEFGPYIKSAQEIENDLYFTIGNQYLFMYATDAGGNLDIKFVHNIDENSNVSEQFTGPYNVSIVNSNYNDAYPSFNSNYDKLFFCSDREGNYDIFYTSIDLSEGIAASLQTATDASQVLKSAVLSSDGNDKCPYIYKNVMVFASDRSGGFGGFDLYYSIFNGTGWEPPVNFGSSVNTEYDEFRPIYIYFPEFENDMLLFSSNRPGGKGGFDLYYKGVSRMITYY